MNNFVDFEKDFFGFSNGWEDLVFVKEGTLKDIFKLRVDLFDQN
ncbi:hypothetical protein [Desulfurobacterium crinifex]